MKVIAQIASFTVVALFAQGEELDGMGSDVMVNNDDDDFNVAYSDVFAGLKDLWKMDEDISKTMFDIYATYVAIRGFDTNGSSDPSEKFDKVEEDDVAKKVARIQADVDKIIDDKKLYLEGFAKLDEDVTELFFDQKMGGIGNYINVLKLQTETIIKANESIILLEEASESLGNEDTADFEAIEMKLQVLEGILVELSDAIANKIVAMRALLAEFGDQQVMLEALPYVSRLVVRMTSEEYVRQVGLYVQKNGDTVGMTPQEIKAYNRAFSTF